MLVMTPAFAKSLRKAAQRERDKLRGRMGAGRFDAILGELVAVIRLAFAAGATGSLFGLEGPLRHAIRSDLCLQGWRWRDANGMACALLEEAFRTVRAERPSWNEGQPEWTIEAGTLIERTRCVRCHKPLPETHKKFCSDLCRTSHHLRLYRLREAGEDLAVHMATRLID
jgi:hypothetical protein